MKPSVAQVKAALRINSADLDSEITDLVDQAHSEMLAKLDRKVYATAEDLTAADDLTGIVFTKDMIRAQILLVGYYLDEVGTPDGERTHAAAMKLLQPYRRVGA